MVRLTLALAQTLTLTLTLALALAHREVLDDEDAARRQPGPERLRRCRGDVRQI